MKRLSKKQLIARLEKSYEGFDRSVIEWEDDLNGTRIRVSAEDGLTDRNGNELFSYWDMAGERYTLGVVNHLNSWLNRNGWWAEWINAGEIYLWKAGENGW
jgi:hypothetical protein